MQKDCDLQVVRDEFEAEVERQAQPREEQSEPISIPRAE